MTQTKDLVVNKQCDAQISLSGDAERKECELSSSEFLVSNSDIR